MRDVVRCGQCGLNQFITASGRCRRCKAAVTPEAKAAEAITPIVAAKPVTPALPCAFDIASAVKLLRTAQGMSQAQLSRNAGFVRTYISKVENGRAIPNVSTLARLAEGLNLPTCGLIQIASVIAGSAA